MPCFRLVSLKGTPSFGPFEGEPSSIHITSPLSDGSIDRNSMKRALPPETSRPTPIITPPSGLTQCSSKTPPHLGQDHAPTMKLRSSIFADGPALPIVAAHTSVASIPAPLWTRRL